MLIAPVAAVLGDLGADVFNDAAAAVGADNLSGSGLDWARTFAKQRAAELVGRKWVGDQTVDDPDADEAITESTRNMLRSKIRQAIEDKLSQEAFAAELRASVFSKDRAERIADYETTYTFHQAALEAFKQSGKVATVSWVTMGDDDVEEICAENEDAGPIALGDVFPGSRRELCWNLLTRLRAGQGYPIRRRGQ